MQFQNSTYYSNRFNLQAGETERIHITRSGKAQARPYPMAISYSHVGLKPAANNGFVNVLKARKQAQFDLDLAAAIAELDDPFIALAG